MGDGETVKTAGVPPAELPVSLLCAAPHPGGEAEQASAEQEHRRGLGDQGQLVLPVS